MRKRYNPRTGKNRAGFTREACVKGGLACRGYETEEDARQRALLDARGLVLREGRFYTSEHPDGLPWQKRRSLTRVNSIELVYGGKVRHRLGETALRGPLRWLRGK